MAEAFGEVKHPTQREVRRRREADQETSRPGSDRLQICNVDSDRLVLVLRQTLLRALCYATLL